MADNIFYSVYSVEVKIDNVTKYGPVTKDYSTHQFPAARGSTEGTVVNEGKYSWVIKVDPSVIFQFAIDSDKAHIIVDKPHGLL